MLSVSEVAEQFGVSRDTVLAWIHSGELEAMNMAPKGSTRPFYRVEPNALHAFRAARKLRIPRKVPDLPKKHRFC
jgi:excisionase family DNA binding protein